MTECVNQDYWTTRVKGYDIIASPIITSSDLESVISQFHLLDEKHDHNTSEFTGRGSVIKVSLSHEAKLNIDDLTTKADLDLLIRKGRRGGAVSSFNKSLFFAGRPGSYPEECRMWQEYLCILELRKAGVRVPKPAFAAVRKSRLLCYSGYLGTILLPDARNLLDILENGIKMPSEKILNIAYQASKEAKKSLELGVLHADLHPGNVMISSGEIYLIDFDKAVRFSLDDTLLEKNKDLLLARWNRAIDKRVSDIELNSILKSGFAAGLK